MAGARECILGIEGGGTKTEWAVVDAGGGELRGGALAPANLRLISDAALLELFQEVRGLAGEVTRVGACLAGCATEADRARLAGLARQVWPGAALSVGSDRDSGFATAFGEGDGIAVIAGTGSAVTGRHGNRTDKAGGWGQLLGDTGSGYQIAVTALRHVLSNYDLRREPGMLSRGILGALGLSGLDELVSWAAAAEKMDVAKLAPVVFDAAGRGHAEMMAAVQQGARALAEYTRAVAERLGLDAPEVRLLGGLFEHHEEYADLFREYTDELLPGAKVEVCVRSGALGAAWLAGRAPKVAAPEPDAGEMAAEAAELAGAATEQANPRSEQMEKLDTAELVAVFIREEGEVGAALESAADSIARAVDLAAAALRAGGRLFYTGAGTSGRLGVLDAAEIPPTFGASPQLVQGIIAGGTAALQAAVEGAEDQAEAGAMAMSGHGVRDGDVVCGITSSGRTPFVLGSLRRARALGARTILLTCNPARRRAESWDVEIDLPTGPELLAGSTRLKAGTATKAVLNILSTCAMVRLGKTRGNLMIDVRATNTKLRARAVRLVRELAGCTPEEARTALESSGWSVRAALEMIERMG